MKSFDNILILISYIPSKNEDNYQKRRIIYELCSKVWGDLTPSENDGSSFPNEVWNGIDDIVFKNIIEKVENKRNIGGIYTIEFMKKLFECVSQYYYPEYKDHSIIPNQNGIFCEINDLYEDDNIPCLFKQCMKYYFQEDIYNELIDDELL